LSRTSTIITVIALTCGPLLLLAWLRNVHVSWSELVAQIDRLDPRPLVVVVGCAMVNAALAGEKWRLVELRLSGVAPARRLAIAYSLIGAALGQFLPVPLASALIRGVGNHLHLRSSGRRGALASVWEQFYDLGVVFVLLPAAFASIVMRDARIFVVAAPLSAIAADPLVGWLTPRCGRFLRLPTALLESSVCVRLYRLSLARFVSLTLMTSCIVFATALPIPLAVLATSIPPVSASAVLSFLPAGLGVNEWSFLFILGAFGASNAVIANFALVNRLVVTVVSIALGVVGGGLLTRGRRGPAANPQS
jgi:hypothetical protein